MDIPSPQTTLVILLGASEWPRLPDFQSSAAFANSANALKQYFLSSDKFDLPAENLLDLFNSDESPDKIDETIERFLKDRLSKMKERNSPAKNVLVYYVGHGILAERDSDYCLALRRTRASNPLVSSMPVNTLAKTMKENARYLRRIIILDSCFSAAAVGSFQGPGTEQIAKVKAIEAFKVSKDIPGRGTSLFCSSNRHSPSIFGEKYTVFSEALLHALSTGDPQKSRYLSLDDVEELVRDHLDDTAPRPEVHSPDQRDGDVARVPLFPNLAVRRTSQPGPRGNQPGFVANFNTRVFCILRDGNELSNSQDKFAYADYKTEKRYAVVDGFSSSFLPARWAEIIAHSFVNLNRAVDFEDRNEVVKWLYQCSEEWHAWTYQAWIPEAASKGLKGYLDLKNRKAEATFIGCVLSPLLDGYAKATIIVIGDTNFFLFRPQENRGPVQCVTTFPHTTAVDFSTEPDTLATPTTNQQSTLPLFFTTTELVQPGDLIVLTTDEMSIWILTQLEEARTDWIHLFGINSNEEFRELVLHLRAKGQMQPDDVTIVIIPV